MHNIYLRAFSCPHCNTKSSFYGTGVGNSIALYCNSCNKGVFFQLHDDVDIRELEEVNHISADLVVDSFPRAVIIADPAIPEDIGDDFEEANRCFGVEAKKATVTMCRRVLQNACVSKGANPQQDLVYQIDELESNRVINPSMKKVAHTIRKIGNWGAHPQSDPLKDVTLDDAGEILRFTSEFLDEIYLQPARLDALRRKKGIE